MNQNFTLKDYLANLDDGTDAGETMKMIEEIERLLADIKLSNLRISHLEALTILADNHPDIHAGLIPNPLSKDQMKAIAEHGLLSAFQRNEVSVEQVFKLAHSVEGLQAFTNTLLEVPKEKRAGCWAEALEPPVKIPQLNFEEFELEESRRSIWNEVAQYVLDWLESMALPQAELALSYRGGQDTGTASVDQTSIIEDRTELVNQLGKLKNIDRELLSENIEEFWEKIPWDEIGGALVDGSTWGSFLTISGNLLNRELDENSIGLLKSWAYSCDPELPGYSNELKLFELLLESTRMLVD